MTSEPAIVTGSLHKRQASEHLAENHKNTIHPYMSAEDRAFGVAFLVVVRSFTKAPSTAQSSCLSPNPHQPHLFITIHHLSPKLVVTPFFPISPIRTSKPTIYLLTALLPNPKTSPSLGTSTCRTSFHPAQRWWSWIASSPFLSLARINHTWPWRIWNCHLTNTQET